MYGCLVLLLALPLGLSAGEETVTSAEGNYRLTAPAGWDRVRPPSSLYQFGITRGGAVVAVSALATSATTEDLVESYTANQKLTSEFVKEVSRRTNTVDGEKALVVQLDGQRSGIRYTAHLTVFSHQGIAYRVVGAGLPGSQELEEGYAAVMQSFMFLKDRPEWLARYEGKPARTALLGGLASFELNRPRWSETTFTHQAESGTLDHANYKFLAGGAWVTVELREARGDAAAELDTLGSTLAGRLRNADVVSTRVEGPTGDQPAVEITGRIGAYTYLIRSTAVVQDGISAWIRLESVASRSDATERDWKQLVRSFRLQAQSRPDQPLAYPVHPTYGQRPPDPALAAFLSRATRVVPAAGRFETRAIASDLPRALVRTQEGTFLEMLATHHREPVPFDLGNYGPIAWSRDGKRVAFASGDEIVVAAFDGKKPRRFPGGAADLAFGPGPDDLLVCAPGSTALQSPVPAPLTTSRLERLNLSDGSRHVLIDFPLARVAHPAVAPDGKRIALVANRDYPRTAPFGGHLYLCAPDGSDLRQLTKEPEDITSVTWSGDGRLYAVRRLAVGDHGAAGPGGSPDLFRVSPDTGEAVNLTRSGRIGRVWNEGREVLLEINAWDVDASQQGIFRLPLETLEKATASRPVPPVADPRAQARRVADRVAAALGAPTLRDVVPTPALMEKAARAFADAAAQCCACPLDFSAASLDRLPALLTDLNPGTGPEPAVILGLGAYYGETLRRTCGAQWKLKPMPLGDCLPAQGVAGNPLIQVVLPLSEAYRWELRDEDYAPLRSEDLLRRAQGQKLILVYPPAYAPDALREETPADYQKAMRLLDAGEARPGLDLLAQQLRHWPRNEALARQVLAFAEAVGRPGSADELARAAVEAGDEVPELLLRYADALARSDPGKALDYYRKAAYGNWPPAEAFIKLGRQYAALGQQPVAESCWRRAYTVASETQRLEILGLLGIAQPR